MSKSNDRARTRGKKFSALRFVDEILYDHTMPLDQRRITLSVLSHINISEGCTPVLSSTLARKNGFKIAKARKLSRTWPPPGLPRRTAQLAAAKLSTSGYWKIERQQQVGDNAIVRILDPQMATAAERNAERNGHLASPDNSMAYGPLLTAPILPSLERRSPEGSRTTGEKDTGRQDLKAERATSQQAGHPATEAAKAQRFDRKASEGGAACAASTVQAQASAAGASLGQPSGRAARLGMSGDVEDFGGREGDIEAFKDICCMMLDYNLKSIGGMRSAAQNHHLAGVADDEIAPTVSRFIRLGLLGRDGQKLWITEKGHQVYANLG